MRRLPRDYSAETSDPREPPLQESSLWDPTRWAIRVRGYNPIHHNHQTRKSVVVQIKGHRRTRLIQPEVFPSGTGILSTIPVIGPGRDGKDCSKRRTSSLVRLGIHSNNTWIRWMSSRPCPLRQSRAGSPSTFKSSIGEELTCEASDIRHPQVKQVRAALPAS